MSDKRDTKHVKVQCNIPRVSAQPRVSVLPNDYTILQNLPTINGVTLKGDLTPDDVNLLSGSAKDYDTLSVLKEVDDKPSYLIVLGEDNASKISLSDFISQSAVIKTADSCDNDAPIGTYLFVNKK